MIFKRRFFGLAAALVVGLTGTPALADAPAKPLIIFAAASLKNALDEAATNWVRTTGKPAPKLSYAASSALAKQIEQGAPADLFISADIDWMDYLATRRLIRPDTRHNLLTNRLALIAPRAANPSVALEPGLDLSAALSSGRLAIASVDAVPAGKYGKAALEKLGAWDKVKDRIAQTENVRAALVLVARGEAPLGIVYASDAAAEPRVRIVACFPEDTHPPIIYPVAATAESTNNDVLPFLNYLLGPAARAAFEKHGFTVLGRPAASS